MKPFTKTDRDNMGGSEAAYEGMSPFERRSWASIKRKTRRARRRYDRRTIDQYENRENS